MGYNYRTELNKRVLKVGTTRDAATVNVKGGFINYGVVKNDFIILDGSIPGPAKRLIRLRKSIRNTAPKKEPQINYISTSVKAGSMIWMFIGLDGKVATSMTLPGVFSGEFREDIVRRALLVRAEQDVPAAGPLPTARDSRRPQFTWASTARTTGGEGTWV